MNTALILHFLIFCGLAHCANDDPLSVQWTLVDRFGFDDITTEQLRAATDAWEIDDEPENLCQGENIFQYSCHRQSNVAVKDGCLQISASQNGDHKSSRFLFNTGKLSSVKAWQYGRFVMRAKLPQGKLLRAVFALKPKEKVHRGTSWLDNGQINGLVYSQQAESISAGLHYRMDHGHSYAGRKFSTKQNITNSFHLYSVEWTNSSIRFFFDDRLFFENTVSQPFDQTFYIVLQLGVGGPEFDTRNVAVQVDDVIHWNNNQFLIDFIEIYQNVSANLRSSSLPHQPFLWLLFAAASCFLELINL